MINPRKLLEMARKGEKITSHGHHRRSKRRSVSSLQDADSSGCTSMTSLADKGHFVVYAADGVRLVLPLACLDNPIFIELFKMSEEEFGLPSTGPIVLPCAGDFLEYAVSLIQKSMSKDVEKALLASIASGQCSTSASQHVGQFSSQPMLLDAF